MVAPLTVASAVPAAAATVNAGAATPAPAGQLVCTLGVAATRTFPGRLSVKPMPACAGLPAPLAIVKVSVEVAPMAMVVGAKALLRLACTTVTVCGVTAFVSPVTATEAALLVLAPSVAPRTVKVTTHVCPALTPTLEAPIDVAALGIPVSVGEMHPALVVATGGVGGLGAAGRGWG